MIRSNIQQQKNILLLKKKPNKNIQWPFKIHSNSTTNFKAKNKKFIAKPLDRFSFQQNELDQLDSTTSEESLHNVKEFIEQFLSKQTTKSNENTIDLIQEKSLDLLDKALLNMISPGKSIPHNNSTLDWEFILLNMIQLKLPPSVLDRVKRKMALITGKDISAMSVTPDLLSDLTITTMEEQMQNEINHLVEKNQSFESITEQDQLFESPVKWLLDLDKKSLNSKNIEIENIHRDYTHKVLNLKPAFF